jgi:hypothetical protein
MISSDHGRLEERSLALHRLVAEKLRADPILLEKARENLHRWQSTGGIQSGALAEWSRIIECPADEVAGFLVETSERAMRLRQSSPFCGILSDDERRAIHESYSTRAYHSGREPNL